MKYNVLLLKRYVKLIVFVILPDDGNNILKDKHCTKLMKLLFVIYVGFENMFSLVLNSKKIGSKLLLNSAPSISIHFITKVKIYVDFFGC